MFRGTTPTLKWRISTESLNLDDIKEIWLTLKEKKPRTNNILTKTLSDEEIILNKDDRYIAYTLSQEETLSFSKGIIGCQLRILLESGTAFATPIQEVNIEEVLKGGVIK